MSTRAIETPDWRTLLVHEEGDPGGFPVLVHHGTPSDGRLYGPWFPDATSKGIRLIGYDRPGYGGSSRHAGRKVADAARDVETIANALELDRFATWGISGGAPHALACAALLPDRVAAAASLAAPAPYGAEQLDWQAGMGEGNIAEFGAALEGEETLRPALENERAQMLGTDAKQLQEAMGSVLSPLDARTMSGELAQHLFATMAGGLADGVDGWLDDDLAFVADWGFSVESIAVPTLLLQGEQDLMVPPDHGRWLAERLRDAEARIDPSEGHLTLYENRIPDVHAWLLEHAA